MLNNVLMLAQNTSTGKASPMAAFRGTVARPDLLNHPAERLTALAGRHLRWASALVLVGGVCGPSGCPVELI